MYGVREGRNIRARDETYKTKQKRKSMTSETKMCQTDSKVCLSVCVRRG